MLIGDKIYSILSSASAITDVVSTRIYPFTRQQATDLPAIVYSVVGSNPNHTKQDASTIDDYRIQFNAYATTARQAAQISELIRTALDRYTDADICESTFNGQTGDYEIDARTYLDITDYNMSLNR